MSLTAPMPLFQIIIPYGTKQQTFTFGGLPFRHREKILGTNRHLDEHHYLI